MKITRLLLFLLVATLPLMAQNFPEEVAMERMEKKGKWEKAQASLRKSLLKEPRNSETKYLLSLFFFSSKNPFANLDSAYVYSIQASKNILVVSPKEREKLRKDGIDSLTLVRVSARIDSASFQLARSQNSEISYQHFIDLHKTAAQIPIAIELRNEVAFLNALKINTYSSFGDYVKRFPKSSRRSDAEARYEKLLYQSKTADNRLTSFIGFVNDFPSSPYIDSAEMRILQMATLGGSPESFSWFIDTFPTGKSSIVARNILYRLHLSDDQIDFRPEWLTDSLVYDEGLTKTYLVPIIKSGQFGFIDSTGKEVLSPRFDGIADEYRCGDINDRLLTTSNGIFSRRGTLIKKGKFKQTKELGGGFLLVSSDSTKSVMHESGFQIEEAADNAEVIANRFVAIQKKNLWGLYSLFGEPLTKSSYDGISSLDSIIILSKSGKKLLTTPAALVKSGKSFDPSEELVFDDVKQWGNGQYWVRNGLLEGVLDPNLNFIISLARQQLRKTSFGFTQQKDGKTFVKGLHRFESSVYKSVTEQGQWIKFQITEGRYQLFDKLLDKIYEADTVWFKGQTAFLESKDSIAALIPSGLKIAFPLYTSFQVKEYGDSIAWLILEDKRKKTVYDIASGIKLFTQEFDQLEPMKANIFLVSKLGKKGLMSTDGKLLVPIEFDAIVHVDSNGYSLLKDKKFGWFDSRRKVQLKPVYDRNVQSYNSEFRIAFRDTGYGLLYADGTPVGNFEWEEIRYWNDSTAMVKKNFQWIVIDIRTGQIRYDRIRSFTIVKDKPSEKIYIIRQDNAYGVISSRHGSVVSIQYSDIVNLGSREVPLYFTERNIEEAGISVIVYYDQYGKIIRKQAMESEELDRISCDN